MIECNFPAAEGAAPCSCQIIGKVVLNELRILDRYKDITEGELKIEHERKLVHDGWCNVIVKPTGFIYTVDMNNIWQKIHKGENILEDPVTLEIPAQGCY